jgi:protein TonB
VVLHATISAEGRIVNLEAVNGPPLLVGAALDAVQQWRYRPYVLNGKALAVETEIRVNFVLHP